MRSRAAAAQYKNHLQFGMNSQSPLTFALPLAAVPVAQLQQRMAEQERAAAMRLLSAVSPTCLEANSTRLSAASKWWAPAVSSSSPQTLRPFLPDSLSPQSHPATPAITPAPSPTFMLADVVLSALGFFSHWFRYKAVSRCVAQRGLVCHRLSSLSGRMEPGCFDP